MKTVRCGKDFKINLTNDELIALIDEIKAILYVRVSTDDQARNGYSLESQISRCTDKCIADFGYKDHEMLAIVEAGESGDNPNRPAMNYALWLLEKGVGKKIVMLHPDRMSRDLPLQHEVAKRVWESGCDIEFVESPLDRNNPESMLMFNIQGSIAQYNKAKILANSKRGRRQMVKNGKIPGMHRLYGYTFDKEKDILVINDEEKKWYRQMVDWVLNGMNGRDISLGEITEQLSLLNVPAPNGDVWFRQSVSRILRNETYLGTFYYGKTEVIQKHGKGKQVPKPREEWLAVKIPALITREEFDQLQIKLNSHGKVFGGKPSSVTLLLKGIAKCGRCGGACVNGSRSKDKNGNVRYRYYTCINKPTKGYKVGTGTPLQCRGRNWRQDIIDEHVWNWLLERLKNPEKIISDLTDKMGDKNSVEILKGKVSSLETIIAEKQQMIERYNDLFALGRIKTIEDLDKKVEPIEKELEELEEQLRFASTEYNQALASNVNSDTLKENIQMVAKLLEQDDISDEHKRHIIRNCIKRVVLYEDKIEIVTMWGSDYANNTQNSQSDKTPKPEQSSRRAFEYGHHISDSVIVVNSELDLPRKLTEEKTHRHNWDHLIPRMDEIVMMYWGDLLDFEAIGLKLGEDWWVIKEMFKHHNVPRMTIAERAQYRREMDFALLYDLHIVQGESLNEIYRKHKFSPSYTKRVIKEGMGELSAKNGQA